MKINVGDKFQLKSDVTVETLREYGYIGREIIKLFFASSSGGFVCASKMPPDYIFFELGEQGSWHLREKFIQPLPARDHQHPLTNIFK